MNEKKECGGCKWWNPIPEFVAEFQHGLCYNQPAKFPRDFEDRACIGYGVKIMEEEK